MTSRFFFISILFCFSLISSKAQDDTSYYSIESETIKGERYIAFLNRFGFHLINGDFDTVLKVSGDYFSIEFKDFNGDGNKDIFLDLGGNTPDRFDLLVFIPSSKKFKQILNFKDFPAPINIPGTKYYYSYHKSGCADMNWDSDLFYISNFRAVRIGNISGRQCNNEGENDGVYINRVESGKKKLQKKLPIEIIWKYKDLKWGFIDQYWKKHYRQFFSKSTLPLA